MTDVVVVVPARDEEDHIGPTVGHVRRSLSQARDQGLLSSATIEVVAHRCVDATATAARLALEDAGEVIEDVVSTTVGEVRARGVRQGLARLGATPASTWVLSTDADTRVGTTWVADVLRAAEHTGSVAVVGLAPLDRWQGSPAGATAYARLLAAKMRDTLGQHQHDHVYGANLAVRADAYLAVGGFPAVPHGEDQALVDALVAGGHRVLRTRDIEVVTSGRLHGRASGGLADRLSSLEPRLG